jgi:hypothetical protein
LPLPFWLSFRRNLLLPLLLPLPLPLPFPNPAQSGTPRL